MKTKTPEEVEKYKKETLSKIELLKVLEKLRSIFSVFSLISLGLLLYFFIANNKVGELVFFFMFVFSNLIYFELIKKEERTRGKLEGIIDTLEMIERTISKSS